MPLNVSHPSAAPVRAVAAHPSPEPLPAIEAQDLWRRFGAVEAVAGVSLSIRRGEFFSLLGPSGCGKTTLLRLIAGLEQPDSGHLRIGGADMLAVPAHKRPVNTVFQSYALFPHLSVHDNVAFGLKMKKVAAARIAERVGNVMALVQIEDLARRRPAQLSGGQKQRVALARALVNEPDVLLLDEPLGALDLKLRKQLQVELHRLQRRLAITFVHVTHDQDEALTMSDRIAVMNRGRIEQVDESQALYERPRTRFVAQFVGSCNLVPGKVTRVEAGHAMVQTQIGVLQVRLRGTSTPSGDVTLAIRPEKVCRDNGSVPAPNQVQARVEELIYSGAETQYRLEAGGVKLTAVELNAQQPRPNVSPGEYARYCLPPEALVLLSD
jgi:spermidine/putrescine transport system ATP-binding protein